MEMTVGVAAKAAGVSAKAVRLWESKALLPPAQRTDAGYRIFTDDDLRVLRFIRQAKTLGLTLPQIKDILDLQRNGAAPCTRVTELLDTRIAEIDRTLAELRDLRRSLTSARQAARDSQRRGEDAVVCRIIENHNDHHDDSPTTHGHTDE
jgi:DNA-binding transcriptional MerR regulator